MGVQLNTKGDKKIRPTMNVTPLVDVVLVMLIIFMVMTPLLTEYFKVHVPKQEEKEVEQPSQSDEQPLVLTVKKDGSLDLSGNPITKEELPEKLLKVLAARGERVIFFDAQDGVAYGQAVEIMDLARSGGAASIAVLTKSLESAQ